MTADRPQSTPTPTQPEPKKRRGPLAFLFKSALGCTAFAIGAFVVFLLMLPTIVSRTFAASAAQGAFNEQFHGTLKLESVNLAWFQEQSIEGAVLSDPEGHQVAQVSATLPSIVRLIDWESGRLKPIRVELEGDLVADDQGVTNLQRALAKRATASAPSPSQANSGDTGGGGSGVSKMLANLDAEVTLDVRRLTWSDADTRRLGAPFEVRGFVAKLTAQPGAPIRIEGAGKLVSDPPGRVSIDATVRGPIVLDRAWPVGSIDADVKIESFSTAMIDGLADLRGDLKELLGPTFDVSLRATGATPVAGDLELALDSQRTSVKVKGRFAENAFVSVGEPAVIASIASPHAVLTRRLAPMLPPGMRIVAGGGANEGCSLRIENLVLPIPAGSLEDRGQVRAALERLRCDFALELPAIRVVDDAIRAPGTSPGSSTGTSPGSSTSTSPGSSTSTSPGSSTSTSIGIDGKLTASVAPGAPLVVALDCDLTGDPRSPSASKIVVNARIPDPWTVVSDGHLAPSEIDARIDDLSMAWIQAFAPADLRIAEALGPTIDMALSAKGATLDSGIVTFALRAERLTLDLAGQLEHGVFKSGADEGVRLRASPPARWVEEALAKHLPPGHQLSVGEGALDLRGSDLAIPIQAKSTPPSDPLAAYAGRTAFALTCSLPALRWSDEMMRAKNAFAELAGATITAHLAEDNALGLTLRSTLDTGSKGELNLDVRVPDAWALARMDNVQQLQPLDIALRVDRLPTALVDGLAGANGALLTWLGPQISTGLDVKNANLSAGHIELRVETPKIAAGFAGKLEGGVFKAVGDEGLRVRVQIAQADWDREVAPGLPPGTQFSGALFSEPVELTVRNISLAIPEFGAAHAAPTADALLAGLGAEATLAIPSFAWSNEELRAAKQTLGMSKVALTAKVAPKAPLDVRLAGSVDAATPGKLEATCTLTDPWSVLRKTDAGLPQIDARVVLEDLPTDMLELFAGPQPMLTSLLGSPIDVEITADDIALDRGSLRAKVQTPSTSLSVAGRIQSGAFVCSGDDGLDLVVNVPAGYVESQLTPMLPAGTRLALPPDAGPLTAKIRNTKFAFASTAPGTVSVRDASAPLSEVDANAEASEQAPPSPSDGESAASAPNAALAFLADLGLKFEAGLPALTYSDAATDAAGRPIVLRDTRVWAELAPGAPPSAGVASKIDDVEPGSIDLTVRALDSLAKLAEPGALDRVRVALDLRASGVPTALVDLLARQDGLLVDTLGQKIELKAKTDALSLEQGTFVVDMTSPQASLHATGQIKDKTLSMSRTDRGVARFGLTPLASERVVGSLVPMMFNLSKPEGAEPVVVTLDDLSFPMSGDLSKLDATVNLNLGEVTYRLMPGLESMIGSLAGAKTVKLPALVIPIRQGIATYDNFPIVIGSQTCSFSGTFSLIDKSFRMSTAIPLSALGKKVSSAIEGARQYLDPNLPVPIEIRGTWKSPKVSIGDEFMKKVVENAAKGGLQDLLKGIGGKKKKD
jgi:hypothetical protein